MAGLQNEVTMHSTVSLEESCTFTFGGWCVCCFGDLHVSSNDNCGLVDDSKYSISISAQRGFSSEKAGKLEGQDESVIIVALESLNDNLCFQ